MALSGSAKASIASLNTVGYKHPTQERTRMTDYRQNKDYAEMRDKIRIQEERKRIDLIIPALNDEQKDFLFGLISHGLRSPNGLLDHQELLALGIIEEFMGVVSLTDFGCGVVAALKMNAH